MQFSRKQPFVLLWSCGWSQGYLVLFKSSWLNAMLKIWHACVQQLPLCMTVLPWSSAIMTNANTTISKIWHKVKHWNVTSSNSPVDMYKNCMSQLWGKQSLILCQFIWSSWRQNYPLIFTFVLTAFSVFSLYTVEAKRIHLG